MQLTSQERLLLVEQAEKFFFEAMRHGWASGVKYETPFEVVGSWKVKYWQYTSPNPEFQGFTLEDRYHTYEGSRMSDGRNMIFYEGQPIWFMVYGGWYDKEVIAFLKEALMDAYIAEKFFGGRGQPSFTKNETYPGMLYVNPGDNGDFKAFRGPESITDPFGRLRGTHDYFGGLLI